MFIFIFSLFRPNSFRGVATYTTALPRQKGVMDIFLLLSYSQKSGDLNFIKNHFRQTCPLLPFVVAGQYTMTRSKS